MIGPSLFSALRVYALTRQNKYLTGITLALGLVPLIVNVSTSYQSHPVNFSPPYNCSVDSSTTPELALAFTALSRGALTLADLIVVGVTWWATYQSRKLVADGIRGRSFTQIMFYNGNMYFVPIACLNMLHITLTALSINVSSGSESYVIDFIDPISSLLVCHFLLALQEVKQQPIDGSLSSVKLSLPYFDPSSLPPFIAPLGGLVHTSFGLEHEGSSSERGNDPGSGGSDWASLCDVERRPSGGRTSWSCLAL
ncbi:hypothetical protein LXA43DRAFT_37343 [Ganoderma leucocontextum]|nr:hypothetical protein LXA43DRAFT_37343 [Ganoderma leucocontextum]